jgi:Tfp pilus assembly protein PilX
MLALLAILGAWVLNTSSTELRIAGNAANTQNAFYCGDAGVAWATNPANHTLAYNTALASGTVTAPQNYGPVTVDKCSFNGTIQYLSTGQLANVQGRAYDQNVNLNTNNEERQRFSGLYFVVDSRGNSAGNTIVPVQMGLQQVVGN